jgi:hypothetical protein
LKVTDKAVARALGQDRPSAAAVQDELGLDAKPEVVADTDAKPEVVADTDTDAKAEVVVVVVAVAESGAVVGDGSAP